MRGEEVGESERKCEEVRKWKYVYGREEVLSETQ